jgi:hypothetical protein
MVDKKYPVKMVVDSQNKKKVSIYWDSSYSG